MKFSAVCLLALVFVAAGDAGANKQLEHPIVKVISLLKSLIAEAEKEGTEEKLAYEKYVYNCGVNKKTLNDAISDEAELIEELSDTIDAKTKEIAVLTSDLEDLEGQFAANAASIAKQDAARKDTNKLYEKTKAELEATLTAIQAALKALEGAETKTESGLAQAKATVKKAAALIQLWGKELPTGYLDDHIDKYDFKSESVIEMLKKLESDFQDKLVATNAAETNSVDGHQLSMNNLDAMQAAVNKSIATKTASKTGAEKDLASAEKDKDDTELDKEADTSTLEATTSACANQDAEWAKRSATRADEIAAMHSAIEIMSKVSSVRTEPPVNPVPQPSPVFLQVSSFPKHGDRHAAKKALSKVANLLHKTATTYHSRMIDQLAEQVSVKMDAPYDDYVFQAIINTIEKMIFHLKEEQTSEDEHKAWCDLELKKTAEMKVDKEDKIKAATTKKTEESAKVAQLMIDIEEANEMVAKIKEFQAEATEARKVGKKENKLALEDAEAAQEAIANAIAVLTEFYKKSGQVKTESWEFLQRAPVVLPENPSGWASEYTAVADPQKQPEGILTVLGGVATEFAKMAEDIKTQEAGDQQAYDAEMSKTDIEKARRKQDVEEKTTEAQHRNAEIKELTKQLKHLEGELGQTTQYQTDLQKACVISDSTYEDRKAARDAEIAGLVEAEGILQNAFSEGTGSASFLEIRRHQ